MIEYGISCKSVRIVSDDAANMKKAFEVQLEVTGDMQLEILDRDQPLPLDEIVDSEDEMENTDEEELDEKLAACIEVLETDLSAKLDGFFEAGNVCTRALDASTTLFTMSLVTV